MNKVVSLAPPVAPDVQNLLNTFDTMRADLASGKLVAFCAVAIDREDTAFMWSASAVSVTRLRMSGAIAALQHAYLNDDIATR